MTPHQTTEPQSDRPSPHWHHAAVAAAFDHFSSPDHSSQRHYARQHAIPRATLGHWLRADFPQHLDPHLVSFFCSPTGLAFLRRLVFALFLICRHQGVCGLRTLARFLELTHLDAFVASSYGALHSLDERLQDHLLLFAKEERQRLSEGLRPRDIALCADEHFHAAQPCLIAIEPVSNFILVEAYHPLRDSVTWAQAIATGTEGLSLSIVVFTSDQASGLIRCAEAELDALHQPELFHLQYNLAPLLAPLARPIANAQKDLQKALHKSKKLDLAEQEKPDSVSLEEMVQAVRQEMQAKKVLEQAQQRLESVVTQVREVSAVYHPFDRQSGVPVTAAAMQARLSEPVTRLEELVEKEGLGERARQAVTRARQWLVTLVSCLGWFAAMTTRRLAELDLSEEQEKVVRERLLGAYYWERANEREKDADERRRLREMARGLAEQAWAKGGPLPGLPEEKKEELERVCREIVGLFARSSSCVEGRNGRLSLFHHGQTRLSKKRLSVLTVVHNYVARRADGSTAAERFFGKPQRDPFDWLLKHMPDLPRPAAKRPITAPKGTADAA